MRTLLTILLLSFSSIIFAQTKNSIKNDSIVFTKWNCEKGIEDAKNDFKNGKYNCYSYGLIVQKDAHFENFLQDYRKNEYGIISKNAGCVISEHSECYSKVMTELVYEKFGSDIFEKSRQEAKKLYETDLLSLERIKEIPQCVFKRTELKYLSVFGQDCDIRPMECFAINEIPSEIGNLKNLEVLKLTLNYIEKLPIEILKLKKLRVLDLTENPNFSDLETVGKIKWLKEFYCFGCKFSEKEIEKLKKELPNCKIGTE
ncbi:MAG: leucine-rich repeat domain-containing protein [Patiriisocius sp.]|uniref:leucine-rich repeat domain-containing protein n=1 Tax=Patiriisocius sp. TaxID=2822396 RepID=UPI003EF94198